MDGVSFSPVSSSSLQRQAGNQICRYRSPLACYGNKARHMCFCVCMCLCVCAPLQLEYWEKESDVKRRWESISQRDTHLLAAIAGQNIQDPIERSNVDHMNSTFHPVNISTTLIMFTYMEISPLNKIFHPGFRSTHWKYQHLVRITLVSSCPYYGKLETRNRRWWWLAKCWHKRWSLRIKELLSRLAHHFAVM